MRPWLPTAALLLAAAPALAQVKVWCVMKEKVFLQYESVPAEIHILNEGSDPLRVSTNAPAAVLALDVIDGNRKHVDRTGRPMLLRPLTVAPGETARLPLDLADLFALTSTEPHTIAARVDFDGITYESLPTRFDVQKGSEVAKTTSKPPRRVFSLRTVVRSNRQMLFVRVDDPAAGVCYGSYELERFQKGTTPRMLFDTRGHLHVLFSHVPKALIHAEISPSGAPISRKYYREGQVTPQFGPDGKGGVEVTGAIPMEEAAR
jgi:hypothetical protein